MKSLLTLTLAFSAFAASAQWEIHKVDNDPFNPPYTICSNTSTDKIMLKLEYMDEKKVVYFYAKVGYICADYPKVMINAKINGEWVNIYSGTNFVASNNLVLLSRDFHATIWADKLYEATEIAIKIDDENCEDEQAVFSNANFKAAIASWPKPAGL